MGSRIRPLPPAWGVALGALGVSTSAILVLGERPSALQLLGCALVLTSAYVLSARGDRADR